MVFIMIIESKLEDKLVLGILGIVVMVLICVGFYFILLFGLFGRWGIGTEIVEVFI